MVKRTLNDLAVFGGLPSFSRSRSTSNLVRPDVEIFLRYARRIYDRRYMSSNIQELEKRLADIHQTAYCVTFCSGFMALLLAMHALAVKGKKEVIMPSLTYRRMADIASWAGLVPHFCDVDDGTLGMTMRTVEPCINKNTALILGVHPITNLCDIRGLEKLSAIYCLPLLFDSVEAAFASHDGKMVGSFGKAEVFSIHASKLLNGFEGGYLTTSDLELADGLKRARHFGFSGEDIVTGIGLNANLSEIHAAMTLASLDDLDSQILRNRRRHKAYQDLLSRISGLDLVLYEESESRGYKNVLVQINNKWPLLRDHTLRVLHAENLLARPYYYPPLHKKPAIYETRQCGSLHTTETLSKHYMLLPSGDFVTVEDVEIIAELLDFLQRQGGDISRRLSQEENR